MTSTKGAQERTNKKEKEMMNAAQVNEIFAAYYSQLREVNGENAPSTYCYFGETAEQVAQEEDLEFDGDFAGVLGDVNQPIVAVFYDCHNHEWTSIHADAKAEDVFELFESCGGDDGIENPYRQASDAENV